MEPVTELRPVAGPVVYGYLRLPARSGARRAALTSALAAYCDRHELLLGGVFTDDATVSAVMSPAFAGLLGAALTEGCYGIVAPSPAHLGSGFTGRARARRLTGTGRRIMLIRGELALAASR